MSYVEPIKNKNFLSYYIAFLISDIGSRMHKIGLMILVYEITGSSLGIAKMLLLSMIPGIVLSPYFGVVLDKYSRIKVVRIINLLSALLMGLFMFVQNIILLYLLIFVVSILSEVSRASNRSLLPSIVDKELLLSSNSILSITKRTTQIFAPVVAGIIIAKAGTNLIFAIDSITFFIAFLLLTFSVSIETDGVKKYKKRSAIKAFREGIDYVLENRFIFNAIVFSGLLSLFISMHNVVFISYIDNVLKADTSMYGSLNSIMGIGLLIGGLLVPLLSKNIRSTILFNVSFLIIATCFLMMGLTEVVVVIFAVRIIKGINLAVFNIILNTTIQKTTSKKHLGRVFSIMGSFDNLCAVVGIGVGGLISDMLGIKAVYTYAGIIMFTVYGLKKVLYVMKKVNELSEIDYEEESNEVS